jgi:hypothetical protein
MKWVIRICIAFVLVILLTLGIVVLYGHSNKPSSSQQNSSNPFGSIISTSTQNPSSSASVSLLKISASDGSTLVIPDFTKTNQPETANATSGYQVAGTNMADFQILYYPQNSGFLITLFTEPLGQTRLEAEQSLKQKLGLSESQLCTLTVQVSVPDDVSDTYSGENLGLSFCPGAVALP